MISSLDKERAWRANARLTFQTFNETNDSTKLSEIELVRLRYFARRIYALGERALYDLFDGFSADASLADRRPTYVAIDPAILSGLGGVALPTVQLIGRAFG